MLRVVTHGPTSAPQPTRSPVVGRRAVLAGGASIALLWTAACSTTPSAAAPEFSVGTWRSHRGSPFFIGHRGSGDVVPEHTLEAYQAALAWGAKALEISVCSTKDGVLVCNHDLTLERTTTLTGPVSDLTIAEIDEGRVDIPRLGPRWQRDGRPRIARLDAVLDAVGSKAILFIEAKDDAAFTPMLAMLERKGLMASVVVKVTAKSPRLVEAKAKGLPVFAYFGTTPEISLASIHSLVDKLDKRNDLLVLPAYTPTGDFLDAGLVTTAVASGVATVLFPVHRRSDLDHFTPMGVVGAVVPSFGYLAGTTVQRDLTPWPQNAIGPGQMTFPPDGKTVALTWPEENVTTLAAKGVQHFVTLGQFADPSTPLESYQVDVEVRVDEDPGPTSNFTLAFAHRDDRYYEHKLGTQDGYHAMLTMQGTLDLRQHIAGKTDGVPVGKESAGPAPVIGQWIPLRLVVSKDAITWSRPDTQQTITALRPELSGSYLHVGRSSDHGALSVRGLVLTRT